MAVQAPDTDLGRTGRLVPVMTFMRVASRFLGSLASRVSGDPRAWRSRTGRVLLY